MLGGTSVSKYIKTDISWFENDNDDKYSQPMPKKQIPYNLMFWSGCSTPTLQESATVPVINTLAS
jgi:hypothetical protein